MAECSHPWQELTDNGIEVDFASPQGGEAPVHHFDLNDPANKALYENETAWNKIKNSMNPDEVAPEDYDGIYFVGGHGGMWDFPDNEPLQNITRQMFESGKVVAGICHGPAIFANLRLSNNAYLVDGRKLNCYTDEEERLGDKADVVPFFLENRMREIGANFQKSGPDKAHVAIDNNLITGQNPASARPLGEALVSALS